MFGPQFVRPVSPNAYIANEDIQNQLIAAAESTISSLHTGITIVTDNTAALALNENQGPIWIEQNSTAYIGQSKLSISGPYSTPDGTSVLPAADGMWVAFLGLYATNVALSGMNGVSDPMQLTSLGQIYMAPTGELFVYNDYGNSFAQRWQITTPNKYVQVEGGEAIAIGEVCYQDPTSGLAFVATNADTATKATAFGILMPPVPNINNVSYTGIEAILDPNTHEPTGFFTTGNFLVFGDVSTLSLMGISYGPVYLGTAGAITSTAPSSPNHIIPIGQRIEPDKVFFNFQQTGWSM